MKDPATVERMSKQAPRVTNVAHAVELVGRKALLRNGDKVTLLRLDTRPFDLGWGFWTYVTPGRFEAYVHAGENYCPSPYDVVGLI